MKKKSVGELNPVETSFIRDLKPNLNLISRLADVETIKTVVPGTDRFNIFWVSFGGMGELDEVWGAFGEELDPTKLVFRVK